MLDMLSLLFAPAFSDLGTDAWDNLDVHFPSAPPDPCATLLSTWVVDFVNAMFLNFEEPRPIVIPLPPIPQTSVQVPPPTKRRRLNYVRSPTSPNSSDRRKLDTPGDTLYRSLSTETVPSIHRTRASPSLSALPLSPLLAPLHQKRACPDEPDLPSKRRRLIVTSYLELPSNDIDDLAGTSNFAVNARRSDKLDISQEDLPDIHRTLLSSPRAASSLASKSAHLQYLWTHILEAVADSKHLDCAIKNET